MKSTTSVLYIACSMLLLLVLKSTLETLYNILISPLRKIPGPWWSSFTGFPSQLAVITRRQVHFNHALHHKYGAFVRVGPNEIIVSDITAYKEIHRIGTRFIKSDFYRFLNPTAPGQGPFNIFAQTNPAEHTRTRKLLARGFSQGFLRSNWEIVVREKIDYAIARIKDNSRRHGEVDILQWWMLMAADIVSQLMFGEAFDMLKLGHKTEWFKAMDTDTVSKAIRWHFPLLWKTAKMIPLPALQKSMTQYKTLFAQGHAAVTNSRSSSTAKNIFANVLEQAEKEDPTMTDEEIIVQAGAFMLAGTDTTANTLTYLIYYVLSDPSLQLSLESEVGRLNEPLSDAALEALPVLGAVIKETLRLHGAAPGALPRITPQGGTILGGHYIPAGTTVSTQAWTLHRDPAIFPDPDKFDHTRWLRPELLSEESKTAFSPFGAGSRICIGMHLAYMELRLAAATFFRECRGAKLSSSTTPESMEVENIFLISPKGGQCKIIVPSRVK